MSTPWNVTNAFKRQISGRHADNSRAKAPESSASVPLPKISSNLDHLHNGLALLVLDPSSLLLSRDSQMEDNLGDGTQGTIIDESLTGRSKPKFQCYL